MELHKSFKTDRQSFWDDTIELPLTADHKEELSLSNTECRHSWVVTPSECV